jgi:hypothetical protein
MENKIYINENTPDVESITIATNNVIEIMKDYIPPKYDKTKTASYKPEDKMFEDKYNTQIPKSIIFK